MACSHLLTIVIISVSFRTAGSLERLVCMGGQGRPKQITLGCWRDSEVLGRRVATITYRKDRSDPETLTDITTRLYALARRVLGKELDDGQRARLQRLARRAKPSAITRTLQSWRFQMPVRTVHAFDQRHLHEARWQ